MLKYLEMLYVLHASTYQQLLLSPKKKDGSNGQFEKYIDQKLSFHLIKNYHGRKFTEHKKYPTILCYYFFSVAPTSMKLSA